MAKKDAKAKEADGKEKEMEKKEAVGDPEQAAHGDVEQDKALIKKMIDEYVGKEVSEEEAGAMEAIGMEAYQAHKEMGANEAEAYERAGHALKLAKHMAGKQAADDDAKKESDDEDADDKKADEKKEAAVEADECADDKKESGAKESNKVKDLEKQLLEARGRLAALETQSKKGELDAHVEKTLRDSGQPNSITKRFKEAAGELKSIKEFDSKWAIFLEGVKNTRTMLDWTPLTEKSLMQESDFSDKKTGKTLDFSKSADE
jgi:hypothetical protein